MAAPMVRQGGVPRRCGIAPADASAPAHGRPRAAATARPWRGGDAARELWHIRAVFGATALRSSALWNGASFRVPSMVRVLRAWLPPVGTCLLLQGSLIGAGLLIHRCIAPPTPCCVSPQVL